MLAPATSLTLPRLTGIAPQLSWTRGADRLAAVAHALVHAGALTRAVWQEEAREQLSPAVVLGLRRLMSGGAPRDLQVLPLQFVLRSDHAGDDLAPGAPLWLTIEPDQVAVLELAPVVAVLRRRADARLAGWWVHTMCGALRALGDAYDHRNAAEWWNQRLEWLSEESDGLDADEQQTSAAFFRQRLAVAEREGRALVGERRWSRGDVARVYPRLSARAGALVAVAWSVGEARARWTRAVTRSGRTQRTAWDAWQDSESGRDTERLPFVVLHRAVNDVVTEAFDEQFASVGEVGQYDPVLVTRLDAHDPARLRGSLRLLRATGAYIHTLDTALGTIDRILRARKQGLADGRRAPHAHDTATTLPHER
ncbi:MAG TPA: hypothetical protein VHE78_05820 [Gemmatimonadaceae bacterium]|nr:hypothetical protein [Gemmatimonadaceae bacterium]